jgi:hypothetical protein
MPTSRWQLAQLQLQVLAELRVQGAQGFVEQQHPRVEHQGPGQRDSLLLASRQLRGPPASELADAGELEGLADPTVDLLLVDVLVAQAEGDVLPHRHEREQGVVLEDGVHRPQVRRVGAMSAPSSRIWPGVGPLEPGDHPQRRGLAAARGAQQRAELAGGQVEVDAVDGDARRRRTWSARTRRSAPPRHQAASSRDRGQPAEVGDEPVDVGLGVLHGQQPLLDLAPRWQEHPAIVLHEPVQVAPAVVDLEEVAVVAHRRPVNATQPLAPDADHLPRQAVRGDVTLEASRARAASASSVGVPVGPRRG